MPEHKFAIYDLDRTITRTGTFSPFLLFWAKKKAPWRLALTPVALSFMGLYAAKLISRARLKELMQAAMMGSEIKQKTLISLVEEFADQLMNSGIYSQAINSIVEDSAAGRRIIIATAAFEFYVRPIASRLNVDNVVATCSKRNDRGGILACVDGDNCYGFAKLSMIEAHLEHLEIDRKACHVRFYSDHISDLPVFAWADEPIAVNPSAKLRTVANDRGWRILDWRR